MSVYEAVGGMPFFLELCRRFYVHVRDDEPLLATYPDHDDLDGAGERLALFLGQYFGGPSEYHDARGAPRLRMRHAPFPIDEDIRDRWLSGMLAAMDEMQDTPPAAEAEIRAYLTYAADALRNRD